MLSLPGEHRHIGTRDIWLCQLPLGSSPFSAEENCSGWDSHPRLCSLLATDKINIHTWVLAKKVVNLASYCSVLRRPWVVAATECPEKPGRLRCGGFPLFFSTDESLTFVHTVGSKGDSKRAKIAPTTITNKEHALAGLKIDLAMLLVEEQVEKVTSQPTAPGGSKMWGGVNLTSGKATVSVSDEVGVSTPQMQQVRTRRTKTRVS